MKPLEVKNDITIKITPEQAEQMGINITQDVIHGDMETVGPWGIPVRFKALCIDDIYELTEYNQRRATRSVIYGQRTMTNLRSAGYHMEGWVSVGGKKYSAFTASQLFEVNGKLIDVATIQVRKTKLPELLNE